VHFDKRHLFLCNLVKRKTKEKEEKIQKNRGREMRDPRNNLY